MVEHVVPAVVVENKKEPDIFLIIVTIRTDCTRFCKNKVEVDKMVELGTKNYDFYEKKIDIIGTVGEECNFVCSCIGISRLVQYLSSYLSHQFEKSRF